MIVIFANFAATFLKQDNSIFYAKAALSNSHACM